MVVVWGHVGHRVVCSLQEKKKTYRSNLTKAWTGILRIQYSTSKMQKQPHSVYLGFRFCLVDSRFSIFHHKFIHKYDVSPTVIQQLCLVFLALRALPPAGLPEGVGGWDLAGKCPFRWMAAQPSQMICFFKVIEVALFHPGVTLRIRIVTWCLQYSHLSSLGTIHLSYKSFRWACSSLGVDSSPSTLEQNLTF